jgi:hypothetical protein
MITGTFSVEDLVAATWVHLRPRRALAVICIFILALFVLALGFTFLVIHREPKLLDWLLLLLVPLMTIFLIIWVPHNCRRMYKQRKDLQRECVFTVSDNGLSFKSVDFEGKKPWSDYLKWKEGKLVFLIYMSDEVYQLVPKHFFATQADVKSFRDTLSRYVKRSKA